jgi:hypothetical protein
MFREYLLSLPADPFPQVQRAIEDILAADGDERFEFGFDLVLRGPATYAAGTTISTGAQAPAATNKRNGGARREGHGS